MKFTTKNLWWVKATHASLTGLIFASFIAILLVILNALDSSFIKKLEQMGIDWGMQVYAFHPPKSTNSFDYEYVFVDVDREACKQFINKDLDSECLTSKPVPSNLIIDFVRAASESGAKIVIVDVNPPEKHEQSEREVLLKGLIENTETSDTWVIAPIYSRPGESINGLVINGDKRFDIISSHAQGRVRLASVATYAVQGTVRSYPTASCLVTSEEQRWVPTIPYLAALLADTQDINTIDEKFYTDNASLNSAGKNDCSQLEITSEYFSSSPNTALNFFDPFVMDRIPDIMEFFYSIPGLSMFIDEQEREGVLWNHSPKYGYYKASHLFDRSCSRQRTDNVTTERCFATRNDLFENKIVILGSGQAQAMDKVHTPIGPMSGSELIINATRAFLEFNPLGRPPLIVMVWDKFKGILIAIGPIVVAWFIIFATGPATRWVRLKLLSRTRKSKKNIIRKCRWSVLNIIRSIMVIIIFITGLYVAYLLEIMYLWSELKQGKAVDLLYPVIALGIQGYTVGARVVLTFFQGVAGVMIGILLTVLVKVKFSGSNQ